MPAKPLLEVCTKGAAEVFVVQDAAQLHVGTTIVHVQVRAADIGAGDLHQRIGGALDFSVWYFINGNVTGSVTHQYQ